MADGVALPQQAVDRLGIEERVVEALKLIVHDADSVLLATMEILFLCIEVGYLGIDADDSIGELEHAGERVDEAVAADEHVAACACLIPAVAVATEQDGSTRSVVEEVILHHGALGCAEECATSAVVADGVIGKVHLGSPCEVLNAIALGSANLGRQCIGKADDKLSATMQALKL